MAAIKVHGSPMSTATQKVLACLYEKGIEFQFVPVNMATGEHKSENYLSLNVSFSIITDPFLSFYLVILFSMNLISLVRLIQPFGQVPAFEDGGLKLFGAFIWPKPLVFFAVLLFFYTILLVHNLKLLNRRKIGV